MFSLLQDEMLYKKVEQPVFLTSYWQSRAPSHKLQEESLLLCIKTTQHLKEESHRPATHTRTHNFILCIQIQSSGHFLWIK